MYYEGSYFIDLAVLFELFYENIWYVVKILIMGYIAFYLIPINLFPQEHSGHGIKKVIFNVLYISAYIEVVIPFMILVKVFSILLFVIVLFLTKLAFIKWYYKQSTVIYLVELKRKILVFIFDALDHPQIFINNITNYMKNRYFIVQRSMTFFNVLEKILFFSVFFYIIITLMIKGMYSYADPSSDTSQYIEWVGSLQNNTLYADHKTFGAYFYGMPIMVFFINIMTNIDQVILFSLYPVLLLSFLFFSLYYVTKDFSGSKYVGIFTVMVFGMIFLSPSSNFFLGKVVTTNYPLLIDVWGFKFYVPSIKDILTKGLELGYRPYLRYMSSLAYEHSSVLVLLNAYFLIKTFDTKLNSYLLVYILSLFLIFIFHAGGAIILAVISVFISILALLYGKYELQLLKKALIGILAASFFGSLWVLSMIKYGIPPEVGDAAPFLDKWIGTRGLAHTIKTGYDTVSIIDITNIHFLLFTMLAVAFVGVLFFKRRFINLSLLLFTTGIFLVYFGPNAGFPLVTGHTRLAEYLLIGLALLVALYFYYLYYKPVFVIFKKYARIVILSSLYFLFFVFALSMPKWYDSIEFWRNINMVQYTSIPTAIFKINDENKPFSWTGVAYVQSFSKIRNKGYHMNTQKFLQNYNPQDRFLTIPTDKVFLFTENEVNAYRGLGQWYYRWRGNIQNNLKAWVSMYKMSHDNIRVYYKTKTITVYEIDNRNYIRYLERMAVSQY